MTRSTGDAMRCRSRLSTGGSGSAAASVPPKAGQGLGRVVRPPTHLPTVLDEFQRVAVGHLLQGRDVLVYAPTGSGKTRIAEEFARHLLQERRGMAYTAPLKAISNQKYRDFSRLFGESTVGLLTGDISINPGAPLLVMTTEIFRNRCLTDPSTLARTACVVLDEIHYLGDEQRGTVWEESVIFAPPHVQLLGLSATVSNAAELAAWIGDVRGNPVEVVFETRRPVPLTFRFVLPDGRVARAPVGRERRVRYFHGEDEPSPGAVLEAIALDGAHFPLLYFVFSRRQAEEMAQVIAQDWDFLLREEKRQVGKVIREAQERFLGVLQLPSRRELLRWLKQGIAYHHAGLAPQLKMLVEDLYCQGLVRVVFCTETFAAGINYPAAAVVFHSCRKWDGRDFRMLRAREFFQMAGRAGRRGFDERGYVYVRVPGDHPQEAGVYEESAVEPVESTLTVTPATVLNMLQWANTELRECFLDQSLFVYRAERLRESTAEELAALQGKLARGELGGKKAKAARNRLRHLSRRLEDLDRQKGAPRRQFATLLETLARLQYVRGEEVLAKGAFAARLRFQELLVTEMVFRGLLDTAPEDEVAAVLAGIDYEPGRGEVVRPFSCRLMYRTKRLQSFLLRKGVPEAFCRWSMEPCALAYHWYRGASFGDLLAVTSMQEGDIIAIFRREIDLLRQLEEAAAPSPLAERMRQIRLRLDRDEVAVVV